MLSALLARDAPAGSGQRPQPLRVELLVAVLADTVGAGADAHESRFDLGQSLANLLVQPECQLVLEQISGDVGGVSARSVGRQDETIPTGRVFSALRHGRS